ncbi:MAG: Cna B-type domain-containing protein [Firmicutes bacterium]|nr:Cna B-type domain-containing protein [Bacillota bacterium]
MKNKTGRLLASVVGILLILTFLPMQTFALDPVKTDMKCTLTLEYSFGGVEFSVYQVAVISTTGELSLTGAFADYKVSLEQDWSGWRALAQTLEVYVGRDKPEPADTGKTNAEGRLVFRDLNVGLYLVIGKASVIGNKTITPQTFLICLPNLYDENEGWVYNVTADPKYITNDHGEDKGTVKRKVIKIWNDSESEISRPQSIEVELLRDGTVFDTVTLDEKNNWSYTWEDLNNSYIWTVIEKEVPDGYTMVMNQEGITFVITNTIEDIPDKPDKPVEESSTVPPDNTDKLPQTGMLWWPVGVLSVCGIGLILVGFVKWKGSHDE